MRVFYLLLLMVSVLAQVLGAEHRQVHQKCDKNEHYKDNYHGCQITCENKDFRHLMGACIPSSGCFCDDGYVRDKHGACIKEDWCPRPRCKANREYNYCGSSCPETCEDNFNNNPNRTCADECVSGCFCKSGFVQDKKGKCIKLEKCPKPECGRLRVFDECGSACPASCANLHDPEPSCSTECVRGCFCRPGLLEDGDGNCVRPRKCPKPHPVCEDPNAEYSDCGSPCPATCSPQSHERLCSLYCQPGCFCKPGYVLDDNSVCVLPSECPNQCGSNEVFKECKTTCPPQACSAIGALFKCVDPPPCEPGCDCLPGFLRDDSGACINGTTCPKKGCGGDPHAVPGCGFHCGKSCSTYKIPKDKLSLVCPRIVCPPGGCECSGEYVYDDITQKCVLPSECHIGPEACTEPNTQYSLCGSACPETCDNFQDRNRTCSRQCVAGCFCDEGYVEDSSGKCVLYSQCPTATCPDNEVFKDCRTVCPPQTCASILERYNCSLEEHCAPGCDCSPGFLRNTSGICIKSTSCFPTDGCGYNEVWTDCKVECPPQTCESVYTSYSCLADTQCAPGCNCLNGYLRNSTGTCIPSKQCPAPQPVCGTDEVYLECGTACPKTCSNKDLQISCLAVCESGCFCIDGYVRNDDGVCVPPDLCPPEPTCGANEVYNNCGTACPKTCQNKGLDINCIDVCVSGCFCAEGFLRNPSGVCVLPDHCPSNCTDPNSEFTTCGTACPDSCDNYKEKNRVCTRQCVIGCACKKGYVYDNAKSSTRRCIRPTECPNQCSTNEVHTSCKTVCPPQTCNATGAHFKCEETVRCEPGCDCLPGYLRDDSGACINSTTCPKVGCGGDLNAEPGCGLHCGKSCATYKIPKDKLSLVCPRIVCPRGGCECSGEYVYDDVTDKCILPSECPKPTCGENETYNNCGTACPKTCANKDVKIACNEVCQEGCFCKEGYVRNDNGSCILENQCPIPACPENEQYTSCIPAICEPKRCDQLGKPIACASVIGPCTDGGCICKAGYLRNNSNVCIPKDNCPPPVLCKENEVFTECGSACPKTCKTKREEVLCPAVCRIGCFCIDGYIRDDNGTCIPEDKCPPDEQCSDPNAEYKTCGSACPDTCENYDNPNKTCSLQCVQGCECKTGYVLDSTGKCVLLSHCPSRQCKENEIYSHCGTSCIKTCANMKEEIICNEVCKSGCFCEDGFVRNDKGNCVSPEQCPQNECKVNETYVNCNARCPTDYCPSNDGPTPVCDLPNPCPPGCRCRINYRLNKDNKCILASECPPVECTRPNEVFDSCPSACLAESCEDVDSQPTTCNTLLLSCDPRCICKDGHFRNASGICIPAKQCSATPKCGANEIFTECGSACPKTCKTKSEELLCPAICKVGCFCIDGYVRDDNGACILPDKCPQNECKANETYVNCNPRCPTDYCPSNDGPTPVCALPNPCPPGCRCRINYRLNKDNKCILASECPPVECTRPNEVFDSCPSACLAESCEDVDSQPTTCNTLLLSCDPRCICKDGHFRNASGICVRAAQCSPIEQCTDSNAEYKTCGSACPDTCDNYETPNRTCVQECVRGCACKAGYVLDGNGKCVLPGQCPSRQCRENEIYSNCGSACPKTCENINEENICTEVCKSGCFCRDNFVRSSEGSCVLPEQCPQIQCKGNETYVSCNWRCPNQYCPSDDGPKILCKPPRDCPPGCGCKPNYRLNDDNECILASECPAIECTRPNEEFDSCPSACLAENCEDVNSQPTACNTLVFDCDPRCVCQQGYFRNSSGLCVLASQCP